MLEMAELLLQDVEKRQPYVAMPAPDPMVERVFHRERQELKLSLVRAARLHACPSAGCRPPCRTLPQSPAPAADATEAPRPCGRTRRSALIIARACTKSRLTLVSSAGVGAAFSSLRVAGKRCWESRPAEEGWTGVRGRR